MPEMHDANKIFQSYSAVSDCYKLPRWQLAQCHLSTCPSLLAPGFHAAVARVY